MGCFESRCSRFVFERARTPERAAAPADLRARSRLGSSQQLSSAAASILTPTPSRASRVLGCLSHMTRVFVPVINTPISVCVTPNITFYFHPDGYARTESGHCKVTDTRSKWLTDGELQQAILRVASLRR